MKSFVDNLDGNTMAAALNEALQEHRDYAKPVPEVCIATAYFNPQGFILLRDELAQVPKLRLLLGAEPKPEALRPRRNPYDPPEPEFSRKQVEAAIEQLELGITRDRDMLNFSPESSRWLSDTIEALKASNIEVRRYENGFLHAKAYLFRDLPGKSLSVGSSNLTRAGLVHNKELNLSLNEIHTVEKGEQWFDRIWDESVPYDLASLYELALKPFPPYLIFLKVIQMLYGDEISEEAKETRNIPVTTFQLHGCWRALHILEKYHGVVIADGVGLGKTFIAGDILTRYRERRQRVLIVAPASLRDETWSKFINAYQIFAECLSYEQLANDRQLGGQSTHLKNHIDEYSLVVVDEAHNYRNPDTPTRAKVLRSLLYGRAKDLVLLTATPVNNSLWDFFHLTRFFLKQDAQLAERGIVSIRDTFAQAMKQDPFSLSPDVLYPIIDAVTVKRPRSFVRKYYTNDAIKDADGKRVPIVFPDPVAISLHYSLEKALPGIFDRIEDALAPQGGQDADLKLARYQPNAYMLPEIKAQLDDNRVNQEALLGLIRSGLLKRFESSAAAFVSTARRMAASHDQFMDVMSRGMVPNTEFLRELAGCDDEGDIESLYSNSQLEPVANYDVKKLREDVTSDRDLLVSLADEVEQVSGDHDPKFDALVEALVTILEEAEKESTDEETFLNKRKVLLFSFFEDTVDDIYAKLKATLQSDPRLAPYRERIASVSGEESRDGISRREAVEGFAPTSTKAIAGTENRFDLLVTTDVLAEGQNLQEARHIINYDLPWNPQRMVQRHGRIDRIGSRHLKVFLRTIFPDDRLDDLLHLEDRIRRKLAHAAASIGVETSPIQQGSVGNQSFTDARTEIEKLYQENPELYERGGTETGAQTGEEYRQILRKAMEGQLKDELAQLPWKAGSMLTKGCHNGWFFCAQIADRTYLAFVAAGDDGQPCNSINTDIAFCLRLIDCTPETPTPDTPGDMEPVYQAWDLARKHIYEQWDKETDPQALHPKIRKLNKEVAAFLRKASSDILEQESIDKAIDILESPWPMREEKELRGWFNAGECKPIDLISNILDVGLEPFKAPAPLPPINEDEIHLVVWMGIRPDNAKAATSRI